MFFQICVREFDMRDHLEIKYTCIILHPLQTESNSVDKQLEWALKESIESEKARQKKILGQTEKEEMDVAIALKQSVESSSEA